MELPGCAVDTKRCRIRATETIGERIVIRIRRSDGSTDVLTGVSVLCDSARGAIAICEHWGVFYLRDVDGDRNPIATTISIIDGHRYRIRRLYFIVECCFCFELSGCAVDTERICIRPTETIRKRVPTVRIRRSNGRADVLPGGSAFCDSACGSIAIRENWQVVIQININVQCRPGSLEATEGSIT